jgi:dimeric dUTPase (all-alpha-NTP-PPase superfamily)
MNLEELFDLQRDLQRHIPPLGRTPEDIEDPAERNDFIVYTLFALEDELHEAAKEVGWKPWATSRHINTDAYLSELVDALHFFVNACLAANISAEMLATAYKKKRLRNLERQQEGYDGVDGKCPRCKRDFRDAGVHCFAPSETTVGYCAQEMELLDD